MIDASALLRDLEALVPKLRQDLLLRLEAVPALDEDLRREHAAAREAGRTVDAYESWREDPLDQAAVAWVLSAVFLRFLEDNGLVSPPRLAGPAGEALDRARDERTLFFRENPQLSDREYLEHAFEAVAALPGGGDLFGRHHNPLWRLGLSGDAAGELIRFFQRLAPETGALAHDFTDPEWDTRFLGDLYQDLSEHARKRYALLQTPVFVEEFLLDHTLDPAVEAFGLEETRVLDPTCGSGHFLLGAFHRLLEAWRRQAPGLGERELVRRALEGVHGVDLNPFAVAIARFRLLLAALRQCGVETLAGAPRLPLNLATGDSLLHGRRFRDTSPGIQRTLDEADDTLRHYYDVEDREALDRMLDRPFAAVVGNPPYITMRDKALNAAYRKRYQTCSGTYSLVVPFVERFFDLAAPGSNGVAGFVGMIVANSFMKRSFGRKLVEEHLTGLDLTGLLDTSGAYIPGHGTPTVILFGRGRRPVAETVRAALGIRGEPGTPEDPVQGLVWTALRDQFGRPGSESEYISVVDLERERLARHPWSLQGGISSRLKEILEQVQGGILSGRISSPIGRAARTGNDDAYILPRHCLKRSWAPGPWWREVVIGEQVRDWGQSQLDLILYPYDPQAEYTPRPLLDSSLGFFGHFWKLRASLARRRTFQGDMAAAGRTWWEYMQYTKSADSPPLSITFAFVATHNHFVLDRGGKVFNRTAPVIKLSEGATEAEHLDLLGLLNSSLACFWMKQVLMDRGGGGIGGGFASEDWEKFYEHDGTKLKQFPLSKDRPRELAWALDGAARELATYQPATVLAEHGPDVAALEAARARDEALWRRMIALQEELDWRVYRLYGLLDEDLTHPSPEEAGECALGERAFEIALARRVAAGEVETAWFERHGSTSRTEVPEGWPEAARRLVTRRLEVLEESKEIALLERPEHKRRWSRESWEVRLRRALREWLLERLEAPALWPESELRSAFRIADAVRHDEAFRRAAALYRGRPDPDLTALVRELMEEEAVPYLPSLRYKPSGLEKRRIWERVWDLQRREDELDRRAALPEEHAEHLPAQEAARRKAELDLPKPPKYGSADFRKSPWWRLRGKLDVPKERFVAYPGAERQADSSPVFAWAGWTTLERARALAAHYLRVREDEAWPVERLAPLLGGLRQLIPWLRQWHDEIDPEFGVGMGAYFEDFLREECRALGLTEDELPE